MGGDPVEEEWQPGPIGGWGIELDPSGKHNRLITLTPTGGETSHRKCRLLTRLENWADRQGGWMVFAEQRAVEIWRAGDAANAPGEPLRIEQELAYLARAPSGALQAATMSSRPW